MSATNRPDALTVDFTGGQHFKFDFPKAFKGLLDVVVGTTVPAPGAWAKAGKGIADLLSAVSIETSPEGLAAELIYRSTLEALLDTMRQFEHEFAQADVLAESYARGLANAFKSTEVVLTRIFFNRPDQLEGLVQVKKAFRAWLEEMELDAEAIPKIAAAFPRALVQHITLRWVKNKEKYQPLESYFDHPFTKPVARWSYEHGLAQLYEDLVMDEPEMRLRDIYQEPYFQLYKENLEDDDLRREMVSENQLFCPTQLQYEKGISLHEYIFHFLLRKNPLNLHSDQQRILILFGQPGQGKTSFCKRLLHDVIQEGWVDKPVVYVRLRDIAKVGPLITSPIETLTQHLNTQVADLEGQLGATDLNTALLILDGLDELSMQDGLTAQQRDSFVKELEGHTKRHEGFQCILTSRYNTLTYSQLNAHEVQVLQIASLTEEQQHSWLQQYLTFHPDSNFTLDQLHQIHDGGSTYQHLRELVDQPILLHLIATANLELTDITNRSQIYQELFNRLINRAHDKNKRLEQHRNLKEKDLRRYLSFVAHKVFQSAKEYVTQEDLMGHPETDRFLEKAPGIAPGELLSGLMVSFYLRPVQEDTQKLERPQALEFLHKSLSEYLAAEYIWLRCRILGEQDAEGDFRIEATNSVLMHLHQLFAGQTLTPTVTNYLIQLIQNNTQEELKATVQTRLISLLPKYLATDFLPKETIFPNDHGKSAIDQALNVFYGYWTVLSHLSPRDEEWGLALLDPEVVPASLRARFFYLLVGFQHQQPANWRLDGLAYPGWQRHGVYLPGINWQKADLKGASLKGANLEGARLDRARLDRARLDRASLEHARLNGASLERARLIGTRLIGARLVDASLEGASLVDAILIGASLVGANLERARLVGARLTGASLLGASLIGANLVGANLEGASLEGASLEGAGVDRTDWFAWLAGFENPPIGLEQLEEKYYVDREHPQEDEYGRRYYIIRKR